MWLRRYPNYSMCNPSLQNVVCLFARINKFFIYSRASQYYILCMTSQQLIFTQVKPIFSTVLFPLFIGAGRSLQLLHRKDFFQVCSLLMKIALRSIDRRLSAELNRASCLTFHLFYYRYARFCNTYKRKNIPATFLECAKYWRKPLFKMRLKL